MNPKRNFDLEYWKTSPKTYVFYLILYSNKNIIDVIDPFPDIFDTFDSLFFLFFLIIDHF